MKVKTEKTLVKKTTPVKPTKPLQEGDLEFDDWLSTFKNIQPKDFSSMTDDDWDKYYDEWVKYYNESPKSPYGVPGKEAKPLPRWAKLSQALSISGKKFTNEFSDEEYQRLADKNNATLKDFLDPREKDSLRLLLKSKNSGFNSAEKLVLMTMFGIEPTVEVIADVLKISKPAVTKNMVKVKQKIAIANNATPVGQVDKKTGVPKKLSKSEIFRIKANMKKNQAKNKLTPPSDNIDLSDQL